MVQASIPRSGLLISLLIGLVLLVIAPSATAQYQVKTPQSQASITVTGPSGNINWEKGKQYEITWTSTGIRGSVKIDLIDPKNKATSLVRMTSNSGKHSFTLMRTVADGDYKVRVSTTDGKTVGESASTVHVGKADGSVQKTAVAGVYQPTTDAQQAGTAGVTEATKPAYEPRPTVQDAGEQASGFTPATGTPGTIGGTQDDDDGSVIQGDMSTASTATGEATQLHDQTGGVTGDIVQYGTLQGIETPESDLTFFGAPDIGVGPNVSGNVAQELQKGTAPRTMITVTSPGTDSDWQAGQAYNVQWSSSEIEGPVKVDLVNAVSGGVQGVTYNFHPIATNTEDDGLVTYQVPYNLGWHATSNFCVVSTLDDEIKGMSPLFEVYTEPIDMTCKVVDLAKKTDSDHYIYYAERDTWLQFDVLVRNNGLQRPVVVNSVSVMLIKEPEEEVVAQEEWGLGSINPQLWYRTPEPRKFNIRDWSMYQGDNVDLQNGAYRLEVEVDPYHQMGEDPSLRDDNKQVIWFEIQ